MVIWQAEVLRALPRRSAKPCAAHLIVAGEVIEEGTLGHSDLGLKIRI